MTLGIRGEINDSHDCIEVEHAIKVRKPYGAFWRFERRFEAKIMAKTGWIDQE